MKKIVFTLLFVLSCVYVSNAQYEIPEIPKKQTSIYQLDNIKVLSDVEMSSLEKKLIRYSDSTSTQIVIVIIPSTKGEDINYLSSKWGKKWRIGQKGKDNGVVLMLARNDRKVAIQAGRGTEGNLTDLMAKRIIESRIIPEFKKGNYYKGLDRGTDGIFEVLTGEFKETRNRGKDKLDFKSVLGVFVFLSFIIILLIFIFRNRGGGGRGGRRSSTGSLLDVIILSNLGRSSGGSFGGFGGGSSSSGGFSGGGFSGGFGGGSFGGGGASGSW